MATESSRFWADYDEAPFDAWDQGEFFLYSVKFAMGELDHVKKRLTQKRARRRLVMCPRGLRDDTMPRPAPPPFPKAGADDA